MTLSSHFLSAAFSCDGANRELAFSLHLLLCCLSWESRGEQYAFLSLKRTVKKKSPEKPPNTTLNRIVNLWGVWRRNNRDNSETVPLVKINILKCYLLTDSKWKYSFIFKPLFWILNLRRLVWATTSPLIVMGFSHYIPLGLCKLPLTLDSVYTCNCWNKKWFLPAYIDPCLPALFSAAMPSVSITKQIM